MKQFVQVLRACEVARYMLLSRDVKFSHLVLMLSVCSMGKAAAQKTPRSFYLLGLLIWSRLALEANMLLRAFMQKSAVYHVSKSAQEDLSRSFCTDYKGARHKLRIPSDPGFTFMAKSGCLMLGRSLWQAHASCGSVPLQIFHSGRSADPQSMSDHPES